MAITAKPTTYTLNTGSSYAPTHLWMLDENTGTNANDTGTGTAFDMTLQNAAQWTADATHTTVLDCNATSSYYALTGTGSVWNGSSGLLLVAIVKTDSAEGSATVETIMGCAASSVNTAYVSMRNPAIASNELMQAGLNDGTFISVNGGTVWDSTWRLVAAKFRGGSSQSNLAASVDGAAWTDDIATTVSITTTPNRYGIGIRPTLGVPSIFNGLVAAAWVYENGTYTDWDDAFIAALYNGGDPWSQFLNTSVLANAFQYQEWEDPLVRL